MPDAGLLRLLTTFLQWKPAPIRSVHGLVRSVAPLCRLLRDEVVDQLRREETRIKQGKPRRAQPFTGLAADWRHLLFPGASDAQFADGYAQTVTFALLLARSRGVDMSTGSIHTVGDQLGSSNALMGRALQLLTDHVEESFRVTLGTLLRVVSAIDWGKIRSGRRDTYLYLYEEFLGEYDDDLRRSSGSYYTPADVVEQMVRLTDDVVRTRLGRTDGLGSDGVNVIDPAAGTGTFLLRIIEAVYDRIAVGGEGAARETVADLATRLYGFELQMGPHAVSELRVNDALTKLGVELPAGRGVALHVTNTLSSDLASRRHDDDGDHTLYIDAARFSPVPAAEWRYDVGGRRVVKSWFDSRQRNPAGRRSSPLDDINSRRWVKADTDDLVRLLGVLGGLVQLEERQAELLEAVCAGPLISHADLAGAAALPTPPDRKLR